MICDLVALVPRFFFSSVVRRPVGVYRFGGWVSFSSVVILLIFVGPWRSGMSFSSRIAG